MEGNARIWFTSKQKTELWERWKSGQCVADIAAPGTSLTGADGVVQICNQKFFGAPISARCLSTYR